MAARNSIIALRRKEDENTVVPIHDAVRPLVSQDIISRNIAVCLSRGNAITTLPSQESYMIIDSSTDSCDKETTSSQYILREKLLRAQTPHTFLLGELDTMMEEAEKRGITYSQSIFTLANELGHVPLHTAEGEMMNFKLNAIAVSATVTTLIAVAVEHILSDIIKAFLITVLIIFTNWYWQSRLDGFNKLKVKFCSFYDYFCNRENLADSLDCGDMFLNFNFN